MRLFQRLTNLVRGLFGRWLGERYRVETEEQPDTAAGEGGDKG